MVTPKWQIIDCATSSVKLESTPNWKPEGTYGLHALVFYG